MTEKQRKCIDWICSVLWIEYCGIDSVNSARKFISAHIDEAREASKSIALSWGNPDDCYNMEGGE